MLNALTVSMMLGRRISHFSKSHTHFYRADFAVSAGNVAESPQARSLMSSGDQRFWSPFIVARCLLKPIIKVRLAMEKLKPIIWMRLARLFLKPIQGMRLATRLMEPMSGLRPYEVSL